MTKYEEHAMREFKAAGWLNEDDTFKDEMQAMMCNHVLKLIEVFSDESHSGSSAPYAVNLFKRLAMFETLAPLTGEDAEWNDVGDGQFQNIRCSRVFKSVNGGAYDIRGKVFVTPDGASYTSKDSIVPVEFPYDPQTEIVNVAE